ncbi:MAG: cytochrome c biogenesis protein DipZ, partial [Acidobacteriota bacterium]
VLLFFGISLLVPALSSRIEAAVSRFTGRFHTERSGDGFWSGTLVGASLGLVYAPCAGPILAGVITVSAAQPFTAGRLAVALSYALGSALVLYLLMLGGRKLTAPLSRRIPQLQAGMGAVMIIFALVMLGDYDLRFQNAIADDLPAFVVNPTRDLESTDVATEALADVRQADVSAEGEQIARGAAAQEERDSSDSSPPVESDLPRFGEAPDFTGTQQWFNTPGGQSLSLDQLGGRVVLVDFWTYSCINCIRTQPYLKAWDERYRKDGLTIVGVHTPEFPFERSAGNVEDAVERAGIEYPVAQDNDFATWDAYANQYWPAEYFIDGEGQVRYAHFGEGEYEEKEKVIRELLAEAGRDPGRVESGADGVTASRGVTTPESYLGSARADRFVNGTIIDGVHDFGELEKPPEDHLSFGGRWRISPDYAVADGGELGIEFGARRVFLVLGSPERPRRVRVLLDGEPIPPALAGRDVENGTVKVDREQLYSLVDMPAAERHRLTLIPEKGTEAYAFTFG